jgi:hypothetical protein
MTEAIQTVKGILSSQIGDGRKRLSCVVNSNLSKSKDVMMLFYQPDSAPPMALGTFTQVGYFNQPVQFAVRHSDYSKSRDIAFQALRLLGVNRRNLAVSLFFDETPTYQGIDATGGHVWAFTFKMRGKQ